MQKHISQVVGTSFHLKPLGAYKLRNEGTIDHATTFIGHAILIPEPENEFDPTAIAVYGRMKDETAHLLGYLAKDNPLKAFISEPIETKLIITHYESTVKEYNDKYQVEYFLPLEGEG